MHYLESLVIIDINGMAYMTDCSRSNSCGAGVLVASVKRSSLTVRFMPRNMAASVHIDEFSPRAVSSLNLLGS